MGLSHADEVRAYQTYLEARDSYIPKLAVGSDIGYAHGFPLSLEGSAPTLFNVTTQSSVWSPALRDFIKAAKADWRASTSRADLEGIERVPQRRTDKHHRRKIRAVTAAASV